MDDPYSNEPLLPGWYEEYEEEPPREPEDNWRNEE